MLSAVSRSPERSEGEASRLQLEESIQLAIFFVAEFILSAVEGLPQKDISSRSLRPPRLIKKWMF